MIIQQRLFSVIYAVKYFYLCMSFSRAHTIVAIKFAQNQRKKKVTKLSTINLVDLAGR